MTTSGAKSCKGFAVNRHQAIPETGQMN